MYSAAIKVPCTLAQSAPIRERAYDVFVAPSGAVFEYGPSVMRVRGKATVTDEVAFVLHVRRAPSPERRGVRVLGISL